MTRFDGKSVSSLPHSSPIFISPWLFVLFEWLRKQSFECSFEFRLICLSYSSFSAT